MSADDLPSFALNNTALGGIRSVWPDISRQFERILPNEIMDLVEKAAGHSMNSPAAVPHTEQDFKRWYVEDGLPIPGLKHQAIDRYEQQRIAEQKALQEQRMEPSSLRKLDLVLGCFHSALRRNEDQTERYLAALRNPSIHILGHPRGRIYNFRLGLTADWSKVFGLAAQLDKAVEIDCYPDRQDLSLDLLAIARNEGCRISLGTDSHGAEQLRFMNLGIAATIHGKLDPKRILNLMPTDQLLEWAAGIRESGARRQPR